MTQAEIDAMDRDIQQAGAIGRNARECQCKHIDYFPNSATFANCLFKADSCIECRE